MPAAASLRPAGILDDAVRQLVPFEPARPVTRLVVVACGVKIHFPWKLACARYAAAVKEIRAAVSGLPIEVVRLPEPFEDCAALVTALDRELPKGVAGLVFFHAAYTAGEIGSHLGRWLLDHPVPVLSWSHPDPAAERNTANSLCCQNFILGMWRRLGVPYAWMHRAIDASAQPTLLGFARASRARARLKHGKILHVGGSRVTAFYDGEADELAVMRRFGLRFDRIDLETAHQYGKKRFSDKQVASLRKALKQSPLLGRVDLPDAQIDQTYRFGLALLSMAHEQGYLAATFKSWPDLFDCYGCAIDGSVSMLNDVGFCVAEEGEMNGAITSLTLWLLSEGSAVPTLQDLSTLNPTTNTIGIWHCGASPTRWLRRGGKVDARRHSILENGDPKTAVGLNLEFLMATGPVTVARYGSPDAATCFAFEGEFVDTPAPFRGTWGEMRVEGSAAQVISTILSRGLDHHWSVGFGHWARELRILNHQLGVTEVPLVGTNATEGLSA
jgi:L-fucose isomerase-like protein